MKASRNPSPLRELRFVPDLLATSLSPNGLWTPVLPLQEEIANVLRQRPDKPESWVQFHFGFLCHEARAKAGWQIGRQPGTWVWVDQGNAFHFMGRLDDGQGQPVIVSTWCPTWPEQDIAFEGYFFGPPAVEGLADTYWWVETYALYKKPALYRKEPGATEIWRLRVGREYQDIWPEAWTNSQP